MIKDDYFQIKQVVTEFTPKEQKLYELLSRRDQTGQLSKMLKGAVRVLNDIDNPVRFAHAANTIRGVADKLISQNTKYCNSSPLLAKEDFIEIEAKFKEVLTKSAAKISDEEEKNEMNVRAKKMYSQLKNVLSLGVRTRKHQLIDLIGSRKTKLVPKKLQEAAEELASIYKYFTDVLHAYREKEPEFADKWNFFQDFLILVSSEFFDIAKEIEPFLTQETISNERSE